MNRLLAIADFVYGEQIRRHVFEPLVADWQNEIGANRSIGLRLRWWFAIASTFVATLPRATFARIPAALAFDLAVRASSFGALAASMQWLCARISHGPSAGLSFASVLPFMLLPVAYRIRVSDLPRHQRRLLAIVVVASAATVALAAETWLVRVALAVLPVTAGAVGWRSGDSTVFDPARTHLPAGMHALMAGAVLHGASWPAASAMGLPFDHFWSAGLLVPNIIAVAFYFSIRSEWRQMFNKC
jgi:hypothetical protein